MTSSFSCIHINNKVAQYVLTSHTIARAYDKGCRRAVRDSNLMNPAAEDERDARTVHCPATAPVAEVLAMVLHLNRVYSETIIVIKK